MELNDGPSPHPDSSRFRPREAFIRVPVLNGVEAPPNSGAGIPYQVLQFASDERFVPIRMIGMATHDQSLKKTTSISFFGWTENSFRQPRANTYTNPDNFG